MPSGGSIAARARAGEGYTATMPLRHHARAFLPLALLPTLLTGCNWLFGLPVLDVTPNALTMTSASATLLVGNTGREGTTLEYSAAPSDPAVLSVSPGSGVIAAGGSDTLTLTLDPVAVGAGGSFHGSVRITSNGGDATVSVDYGTIGICGTFQPAALAAATAPAPAAEAIPGEIIVGYRRPAGLSTAAASRAVAAAAAAVRSELGLQLLAGGDGGPDLVRSGDVPGTLARLRADARVRYVQRNYRVALQAVPNDPYYPTDQWNLSQFGLPEAWAIETGESAAVVVAVIDSGVLSNHQDLSARMLPGYDFFDDDANANPGSVVNADVGHGTHVAGIAAAVGGNGLGIAGVAYGSKIRVLPVKIFADDGSGGTIFDLVRAIRWSAGIPVGSAGTNPNKADIINMSLGVQGDQPAVDAAAQEAWNAGVLLVAASGNHNAGALDVGVLSPANAPCVMAVGSVDGDGTLSYFSNTGPQLEVVAPGGYQNSSTRWPPVLSTWPTSPTDYDYDAGTSMAAPFVAGVAALLKSRHPTWTAAELRRALESTTRQSPGMDPTRYGYGVVCADAALGAATTCGH